VIVVLADAEYAVRPGCREEWKQISQERDRWMRRVFPLWFDKRFEEAGYGEVFDKRDFSPPSDAIWQRVEEVADSWQPQDLQSVFLSPDKNVPIEYPGVTVETTPDAIRARPWQEHAILISSAGNAGLVDTRRSKFLQDSKDSNPNNVFAVYYVGTVVAKSFYKVEATKLGASRLRGHALDYPSIQSIVKSSEGLRPMRQGTLDMAVQFISKPRCNVFYADTLLHRVLRSELRSRFVQQPNWLGCRWFDVKETHESTVVSAATRDSTRLNVFVITDGFMNWVREWHRGNGKIGRWLPGFSRASRDQIMIVADDLLKNAQNREVLTEYWRNCIMFVSQWDKVGGRIESDAALKLAINAIVQELKA